MAEKQVLPVWRMKSPMYLDKKDNRYKKSLIQIKENGFSDSETWNLFSSIAAFTIPRLKRFKKINNGFPGNLTSKGWDEILDKIIYALEYAYNDNDYSESGRAKYEEGIKLFAEYFQELWW